jgi:ABC-2 type transport system ATP-binding protein
MKEENYMYLKFDKVSKFYNQKKVLDELDFRIKPGEIIALIGENGAGKTTTIKCLMKLIRIDKGNIFFDEKDIYKLKNKDYKISYIPDTPIYFEQLSVLENLQFICAAYKEDKSKIDSLVQRLELIDYLNVFPTELSQGNKQKLMIAGALLRDFDILIADEPFDGLDPLQIKILKELFIEKKKEGKIILVSIHSLDLAQTFCDYFVILKKGRLLLQGTKSELLNSINQIKHINVENIEDVYIHLFSEHSTKGDQSK